MFCLERKKNTVAEQVASLVIFNVEENHFGICFMFVKCFIKHKSSIIWSRRKTKIWSSNSCICKKAL